MISNIGPYALCVPTISFETWTKYIDDSSHTQIFVQSNVLEWETNTTCNWLAILSCKLWSLLWCKLRVISYYKWRQVLWLAPPQHLFQNTSKQHQFHCILFCTRLEQVLRQKVRMCVCTSKETPEMTSRGSMTFPKDLLIFRPYLSLTREWKSTCVTQWRCRERKSNKRLRAAQNRR